jgi:GNAT superfamily N-acetyltransferase
LAQITLRDKTRADIFRVSAPDEEWTSQIAHLLGHKPASFRWANELMLRESLGIEVYFYVVAINGSCFANIKTMDFQGVGILGDVFTRPENRGRGAASHLMQAVMDDFKTRGSALYLGTGYDTAPYHMYAKYGFKGIEPNSGTMHYFASADFEEKYFAPAPATIRALDWRHYPVSPALFTASIPGVVRNLPLGLIGRRNSEGALVEFLKKMREDVSSCGGFGLQKENGALVGLAAWDCDPAWPDVARVDVFCHPDFWHCAIQLLDATLDSIPNSKRALMAYGDTQCPQKSIVFEQAGFVHNATLKQWVQSTDSRVDVSQYIFSKHLFEFSTPSHFTLKVVAMP